MASMGVNADVHSSRHFPVPRGFTPEGVDKDLFDKNTLHLITHALPTFYQKIFLHLLYYATTGPSTTMQPGLFKERGESKNEAIILLKNVAALSKTPGSPVGPETYHKAIPILEVLKVLRREFHKGYIEVRMSLGKRGAWIPEFLVCRERSMIV